MFTTIARRSIQIASILAVAAAGCAVAPADETSEESVEQSEQALLNGALFGPITTIGTITWTPIATETLTGRVAVLNVTTGASNQGSVRLLMKDGANALELIVPPATMKSFGGLSLLRKSVVQVTGYRTGTNKFQVTALTRDTSVPLYTYTHRATDLAFFRAAPTNAVAGSLPYVTVMCRFPGMALPAREEFDHFEALLGNERGGMGHYYGEVSGGAVNFQGSEVQGWNDMPFDLPHYINAEGKVDVFSLVKDCVDTADNRVYFPDFAGVHLAFSHNIANEIFGGAFPIDADGENRYYNFLISSPMSFRDSAMFARTFGFSLGMRSSGLQPNTMDSRWDALSSAVGCPGGQVDPAFGCLPVHPIAFHKRFSGWIPSSKIDTVGAGSSIEVELEGHAIPATTTGKLLAIAPIGGTRSYTIEARTRTGYDASLRNDAVLIHSVDEAPSDNYVLGDFPARIIDADGNGNPNDAGAEFTSGETFRDEANSVQIDVLGRTTRGFRVRVTRGYPLTVTFGGTTGTGPTVTSDDGSVNCSGVCTRNVPLGRTIKLTAVPPSGFSVSGWTGCLSVVNAQCTVKMDAAKTVRVNLTRERRECECLPSWPVYKCQQICGDNF
jgi:hypothetical protein